MFHYEGVTCADWCRKLSIFIWCLYKSTHSIPRGWTSSSQAELWLNLLMYVVFSWSLQLRGSAKRVAENSGECCSFQTTL